MAVPKGRYKASRNPLPSGSCNCRTGTSSGFRIVARPRLPGLLPANADADQWHCANGLPGYSGGTATELHRVPYLPV